LAEPAPGISAAGGWSGDGTRIVFASSPDSDLYVMNPDGSAITRLTHAGGEEQEPTLSPCRGACQ
jgi:Tol biopolymer transport system component